MLGDGECIADRFRILRFIGQGSMGQVYAAEDLELGTQVAIKVSRLDGLEGEGLEREGMEQLRREVQMARRVTHRNVCRIYDMFQHRTGAVDWGRSGQARLVVSMELLEGESLGDRLASTGAWSESEGLGILRQIAEGLDAAHGAGIVHGDLSSSNVILVPDGRGERAVITDFGLAREIRGMANPWRGGTPDYLAPELEGTRGVPTPESDLFALAVLAHKITRGCPPGEEQGGRPVSRRLEAALRRGLDPDPERRYPSARDLVDAMGPPKGRVAWGLGLVLGFVLLGLASQWSPSAPEEAGLPQDRGARTLYRQGLAALEVTDFEGALESLRSADRTEANNPLIRLALADVLAQQGQRGEALAILEDVLASTVDAPPELRSRIEGRHRELTYDWVGAEDKFRALVLFFPEEPTYVLRLASVLTHAGKPNEAITVLEALRATAPDRMGARLELALARAARARADLPLQRTAAQRAADAAKASKAEYLVAEAGLLEAEALARMGEGDLAQARLEESRRQFEALGDRFGLARVTLEFADRRTPEDLLPLPFEEALAEIEASGDRVLEARLLVRLIRGRLRAEEPMDEIEVLVERADQLANAAGNPLAMAEVQNLRALIHWTKGHVEEAERVFAATIAVAEASGNLRLLSGVIGNHGRTLMHLGRRDKGWEQQLASIEVARRCGCQDVLLLNLYTGSILAGQRDDAETADRMTLEMLEIAESSGDVNHLQISLSAYRGRLESGENYGEALAVLRRQLVLLDRFGPPSRADQTRSDQGKLLAKLGRYDEAEAVIRELVDRHPLASKSFATGLFHMQLANTIMEIPGRLPEADAVLADALEVLTHHDEYSALWSAASVAARIETSSGGNSLARRRLESLASNPSVNDRAPLVARLLLALMLRINEDSALATQQLNRLIVDPNVSHHAWILEKARDVLEGLQRSESSPQDGLDS